MTDLPYVTEQKHLASGRQYAVRRRCDLRSRDAAEALLVLEAHDEIMLVFTDVNMPGEIDGVALAAKVSARKPSIQCIVTSGRERFSDGMLPDHASFLPKPYRQAELLNLVAQKLAVTA